MLLAVHLAVSASFLVLSRIFARGRGTSLIAGYNTAAPEEKALCDEKKLCRAMSRLMLVLALCWLVIAASALWQPALWIGLALFVAAASAGAVCIQRCCKREHPVCWGQLHQRRCKRRRSPAPRQSLSANIHAKIYHRLTRACLPLSIDGNHT